MIVFPNCKINIGLSITEKRNDGFHNIETIMYPVNLCDILEIIQAGNKKFKFNISGIKLNGDKKENLVVKAFELIKSKYDIDPVHIHLHKNIPSGAGLGGGSSDAAYTITILNKIFELNLSDYELEGLARELGSDCAFFIRNRPVLATEKGDKFQLVNPDLKYYKIVIVKPNIHINTTEAYSWINPFRKSQSLKEFVSLPVSDWQQYLINDFEMPIFKKYPVIEDIKTKLLSLGAVYSSLTGSGAAVYGLFPSAVIFSGKFNNCYVWKE